MSLLSTTNVWAAISITGASGVSAITLSGTPVIFGGLAGPDCGADVGNSPSSTCNSCKSTTVTAGCTTAGTAPLCVCNEARIHSALQVNINLKKDTADTGTAAATLLLSTATSGTAATCLTPSGASDTAISFPWSQVCSVLGTDATCGAGIGNVQGTLTVFLDKNNNCTPDTDEVSTTATVKLLNPPDSEAVFGITLSEGIGRFTPYPGDEKVFIEGTSSGSAFPNLSYTGIATTLRVYMSDGNLDDAHPKGATRIEPAQDLPIDTQTNELTEHKVDALENGTRYYFRVAIVDNAGNVVQFFPPFSTAVTPGYGADCTTGAGTLVDCAFSAVPDQVLGMLSKDINCFVATAAYGTTMEPKLKTFREFRYKILLQHSWGVWFVKKYYEYGPKAAQFIYDKPAVRAAARLMLWPAFGFTWLSLRLGLLPAALLSLTLLSALITAFWMGFRRSTSRV